MKPRQEIEILQNILSLFKDHPRSNRELVVSTYLNDSIWRKYQTRLLELDLIDEFEIASGRVVYDITPRGKELLNHIDVYRSIWYSFPPKQSPYKKQFSTWQKVVLRKAYETGETGFTTKEAWIYTKNVYRITRTPVSTFLHRLVEKGILDNNPKRGRGGLRSFFTLKTSEHDLESFLEDILDKVF